MRHGGFTQLELVVLGCVLLASAAIVYPVVNSEVIRADRAATEEHCRLIAVALGRYLKDVGAPPVEPISRQPFHWLRGPGTLPSDNPFRDRGAHGYLAQILIERDPKLGKKWLGPYLEQVPTDPWGAAYLVNTHGLHVDLEQVWILSAGPNGVVETPPDSADIGGDDIGRVLP